MYHTHILSEMGLPPLESMINFQKMNHDNQFYNSVSIEFDMETLFGIAQYLPEIIAILLSTYAPKVFSFYYNGRHLVNGTPQSVVALNLYFLFMGVVATTFMAVNGGYAMGYSIYWCMVMKVRAKCDRVITYATGGTNISLDKDP